MSYPTNKSQTARTVRLTLGDPSNDGHGQTEVFSFSTEASDEDLAEAYKDSSALFGFRFGTVCEEYEDRKIELTKLVKLRKLGYAGEIDPDELDTDDYVDMFMFYINQSLGEGKQLKLVDPCTDLVDIINDSLGYGLLG